jgi:hypothetical protein
MHANLAHGVASQGRVGRTRLSAATEAGAGPGCSDVSSFHTVAFRTSMLSAVGARLTLHGQVQLSQAH